MAASPAAAARQAGFDLAARYLWAPDIAVAPRGAGSVQIGTEPPRQVLVRGITAQAVMALRSLAEPQVLADVVDALGGDPAWPALFARLHAQGLLTRAEAAAHVRATGASDRLAAERLALTHQYGAAEADRLLSRRADAVVVIEGWEAVTASVGELLDASGIGRIYRPARAGARSPAAGLAAASLPSVVRQRGPSPILPRHPPSQTPPDLVLLIGAGPPSAGRGAELVTAMLPHLAVRPSTPRGVVGPLVLPGRTACLNCMDRHRSDHDPLWDAARGPALAPTPLMAQAVAGLAAREALDWIDGMRRPASVGATLEYAPGRAVPARRTWPRHPACGCQWVGAR